PGVILCECCLQSGAILLAHVTPSQGIVPVATRIDGAKFKRMVRPGGLAIESQYLDRLAHIQGNL
ncbi:MAG: beta-hydroxyacyl-ACP dehydratase, partial [Pirellula sp.]